MIKIPERRTKEKPLDKEKIIQVTQEVLKSISQEHPDLYFGTQSIEREVSERLGLCQFSIEISYIKLVLEKMVEDGTATRVMRYGRREDKVLKFPLYRYVL